MRILTLILSLVCLSAFAEVTLGDFAFIPGDFAYTKEMAEKGEADAQCYLGLYYTGRFGVSKNLVLAAKWFRKSAEQGLSFAQYELGLCYYKGEGVKKDLVQAVKWYRKAAEQGHALAQSNLGGCYYNGEGVLKDLVESYAYYNLAVITWEDDGKDRSIFEKEMTQSHIIEKEMTPSQREAGVKRSKELLALVEANKKKIMTPLLTKAEQRITKELQAHIDAKTADKKKAEKK